VRRQVAALASAVALAAAGALQEQRRGLSAWGRMDRADQLILMSRQKDSYRQPHGRAGATSSEASN